MVEAGGGNGGENNYNGGAKIGRELALAAATTSVTQAWLDRAASGPMINRTNDQPASTVILYSTIIVLYICM